MRALALIAGLSIVFTLVTAATVLRHPATELYGPELVGRHHDPFTVIEQYAAGQVPPPYLQPATDLAGIWLAKNLSAVAPTRFPERRRIGSAVAAYNALILITFPLAAVLAYAHAKHLIGSAVGASVAALLFTLSPFHVAHASYHIHIAQIQWVPLFFLTLWRLLERPSVARAAAVAAALLLVGAASFYLGFVTGVIAPVAALSYFVLRYGQSQRAASLGWTAAALAAAATIAIASVWLAWPQVLSSRSVYAFPPDALDQHSARWWSYMLPPLAHPVLRDVSASIWKADGINLGLLEQQVSLGVAVGALALVPLLAYAPKSWRRQTATSSAGGRIAAAAPALAVTAGVALLCSLGPDITIGALNIPMPSRLLYEIAPMFRAYARFGVIVSLMVTTLAGAGVALLLERRSRTSTGIAVGLLALAAFEYVPALPMSRDVLPTSAHRSLADAASVRVLDCTTPTAGATAGVPWLMRPEVVFSSGPLADCGESDLGAKLAAFGFTHLLIRLDSAAASWIASGGVPDGVREFGRMRDASIFEVTATKPSLYVTELSGFYPREYSQRDSWRWMGPRGTLTVLNITHGPVTATLDVELEAFGAERRIEVSLDDAPVGTLRVGGKPEWHTIGPLTLPIGSHTIACVSDATLRPALTLEGSTDDRPLSMRLRRWRWQTSAVPSP